MILAIDIETSVNMSSEYRHWRQGFKIDSIAASWRDGEELRNWYSSSPHEIDAFIRRLAETQHQLVVHNLAFEMGVFMKLYPDLTFNWYSDTMRLAQLQDNGGDWATTLENADDYMDRVLEGKASTVKNGLGLEAVASRFLPRTMHEHKSVAHKWLEDNHNITKKHGSYLHLLPDHILRDYNIADTDTTLLLYEVLNESLTSTGFDWRKDWILYSTRTRLMQEAYIRGLKIDLDKLRTVIYELDAEVKSIEADFMTQTAEARVQWAAKFPGKLKRSPNTPGDFNIGSNTQLRQLFVDVLGAQAKFTTLTGKKAVMDKKMTLEEARAAYPSFQSKHLDSWGPLGKILKARRKKLLVLQQALSTYMGALEDGRLHAEMRTSGTVTNRVSGGISV